MPKVNLEKQEDAQHLVAEILRSIEKVYLPALLARKLRVVTFKNKKLERLCSKYEDKVFSEPVLTLTTMVYSTQKYRELSNKVISETGMYLEVYLAKNGKISITLKHWM